MRLGGQEQPADPAVVATRATLNPIRRGQSVDQPDQGDRLDLQDFRKPRLADPLVAREMGEHLAAVGDLRKTVIVPAGAGAEPARAP